MEYILCMTQAVARILAEVERLTVTERAELADRLVEGLGGSVPTEVAKAQISEVRRRIAQIDAREATLIPGEQALAEVRRLVARARKAN